MKSHKRRSAFTLIEVMLVLLIIGGLAAVAVFTMGGTGERANVELTQTRIKKIVSALDLYRMHMKDQAYPTEELGGLRALITKPDFGDEKKDKLWSGPYLQVEELTDFWGQDLKYELVEDSATGRSTPHVSSSGPDKQPDTDDDIKSWSEEEGS